MIHNPIHTTRTVVHTLVPHRSMAPPSPFPPPLPWDHPPLGPSPASPPPAPPWHDGLFCLNPDGHLKFCMTTPGIGHFVFALIGGTCTTMGLMQMVLFQRQIFISKMLLTFGEHADATVIRKWTRRVRRGKHGHHTYYNIEAAFITREHNHRSGRIRAPQHIRHAMLVQPGEYHAYEPGQTLPMVYVPHRPTICGRHPVAPFTSCAHVASWFYSPCMVALGVFWVFWSGGSGTVLVIYLCWVGIFGCLWASGGFEDDGFGQVVRVPQGLPAEPTGIEPALGVPAARPTVIPAVRGAPLLPRSLTVSRIRDKWPTSSGQPVAPHMGQPMPIAQPIHHPLAPLRVGEQVFLRESDETESAWVVKVLSDGRYAVDYRDGRTSYEEIDGKRLRRPRADEVRQV